MFRAALNCITEQSTADLRSGSHQMKGRSAYKTPLLDISSDMVDSISTSFGLVCAGTQSLSEEGLFSTPPPDFNNTLQSEFSSYVESS